MVADLLLLFVRHPHRLGGGGLLLLAGQVGLLRQVGRVDHVRVPVTCHIVGENNAALSRLV